MENVLIDLYRKQSTAVSQPVWPIGGEAFGVLDKRLGTEISHNLSRSKSWAENSHEGSSNGNCKTKRRVLLSEPLTKEKIDENIQRFGSKASRIPGFTELEKKQSAAEIVCWSLILFGMIGLTAYSFCYLIMDYLANPTRTNVKMYASLISRLSSPATLCVPFFVDTIPMAEKTSNDALYTWKETARTLGTMLEREHDLRDLFSCPHPKINKDLSIRNVEARIVNELGKPNKRYGRVEIKLGSLWGSVCNNGQWSETESRVVCWMVTGKLCPESKPLHAIQSPNTPSFTWMDQVSCNGTEDNIGQCGHMGWAEADCTYLDYAAVDCVGDANPDPVREITEEEHWLKQTLPAVQVRLRNERNVINKRWGTVELGVSGIWGHLSDKMWDNNGAMVICRMLGWKNETGEAYLKSVFAHGQGPLLAKNMKCLGNETNLLDCPYDHKNLHHRSHSAGVDCTGGQAGKNIRRSKNRRKYALSRTAATLLARLTALETARLVRGETRTSFKWSTSPEFPSGTFFKELAVEKLLKILRKNGVDLDTLTDVLSCGICDALGLGVFLQLDQYTSKSRKVLECDDMKISWVEATRGTNKICFYIPLEKIDPVESQKIDLEISLNLGNVYTNVPWENETARHFYSDQFKIDFSGSMSTEEDTIKTIHLFPGEQQTVTIDPTAHYNMKASGNDDCDPKSEQCELKCIARIHQENCSRLCVPFTWRKLFQFDEDMPYCMLEDYRHCYNVTAESHKRHKRCVSDCKVPCEHTSYAGKTLFRKPLQSQSTTKLRLKLSSEAFPLFEEVPAVNWYNLMGDMGGVIGLWLGASFCGVIHFIWFVISGVLGNKFKDKTKQPKDNKGLEEKSDRKKSFLEEARRKFTRFEVPDDTRASE